MTTYTLSRIKFLIWFINDYFLKKHTYSYPFHTFVGNLSRFLKAEFSRFFLEKELWQLHWRKFENLVLTFSPF